MQTLAVIFLVGCIVFTLIALGGCAATWREGGAASDYGTPERGEGLAATHRPDRVAPTLSQARRRSPCR